MSFRPAPETAQVAEVPAERRMNKADRPEAFVVACDGTKAIVQGDTNCIDTITGLTWAVGRMLSIVVGEARVVGMICDIDMPVGTYSEGERSILHFRLELQGEVKDGGPGEKPKFVKGITSYPGVGSVVHQIRAADLASMYAATGSTNGVIGSLSQDDSIPAFVDIPDMLAKHFAVLGSTGCGKSASVSLLLHCCQELVPDLRTIILDPHNEYSRAFPDANTITQPELDMPFWLFHLEEYVEVLFRGKPLVHEEVDALREFIPDAKVRFRDGEDRVKLRSGKSEGAMTADTAAPYRMADLLAIIDDEMGLLESRYDKSVLKSLKARIAAHCNDARYAFMFRHKTIEDIAEQVIGNFFCMPGTGNLNTIIQMAGMPAEVVNSVASVLCRLSFELAIAAKGNMKILVVCEEAHRYVPAGKDGFEPTRRAIARIAKEGRKYGSFMAIISQRPSELDPTILSQCSTVFSLRLTNHFDQEIIKRAISSSSESTVSFISSLSNRECIAFGEGMSTPMRMRFRNLPREWLPGAEADVFGNNNPVTNAAHARMVFNQWKSGAH
ncbi:MAG: ATP-binding protein [Pseudomonadota bacterium]